MDQNDHKPDAPTGPSHIAYAIRDTEEKSYWNRIGSAFEHKDGKGFNLQLEAVPVDGRVTLRSNEERLQAMRDDQPAQNGPSQEQDRGR